jgi:Zn-dependent protease
VVNPLSSELTYIVVSIAIVLLSLTVHEAAHAWSADRLGDSTARVLGRVSLNPLVHIDLVGTILLPLIAAVSNFPIIGWAKPVPVNTSRLAHPRRDFMIVAAAGPASNIALAVLGAVLVQLLPSSSGFRPSDGLDITSVLFMAGSINIFLAVFNLIPIPPLDGGNVLAGLLPPSAAEVLDRLRPFGFILLYVMMFTGILGDLIVPPARFLLRLLFP